MGIRELKKELNHLEKKDMVDIITNLYRDASLAKEILDGKFSLINTEEIFQKYRKLIVDEFFPEKGFGKLRYSNIRDALSKFKKISNDTGYMAELLYTYVRCGIDFTGEYGDIDGRFYDNIGKALYRFLVYISENNLLKKYRDQCFEFIDDTRDMGWGFNEEIGDLIYEFYEENKE